MWHEIEINAITEYFIIIIIENYFYFYVVFGNNNKYRNLIPNNYPGKNF